MQVGQPFNPFRLFTGIFIPEGLVRANGISPGAKLAYGRLARYAGQDGRCYPSMGALAAEIAVGERQARKYITELERANSWCHALRGRHMDHSEVLEKQGNSARNRDWRRTGDVEEAVAQIAPGCTG
jgi:hypothetical protein